MLRMKITKILPLILLLLLHAKIADAKWYDVEMIFFSHNGNSGLYEERWPEDPGQPDSANAVQLISVEEPLLPDQLIEFQRLPLSNLTEQLNLLERSSRYHIIDSVAWRQPGLREKNAPTVAIQAGRFFTPDGAVAPLPSLDSPAMNDSHYELEGQVKISLSKYLNVDADLVYRTPVMLPDEEGNNVSILQPFRLQELRRMRSKSLHYLDHPMFGILVAIEPYKLPEPEIEVQETSVAPTTIIPKAQAADINKSKQTGAE
ncbi:MAG: hypothetical protein EP297_01180 [Gammaproteobacteria bacterium]|nr:MAG: hypothetical protein EP297_01180 [Gammaproteobacteria bacterium]